MMRSTYYADGEQQMVALGKLLGECLAGQTTVFLEGQLGAGKTTFSRGVLQAFGHQGPVKSPTYTLVEPYLLGDKTIYHFDLYRLSDPEELEYMGIRDYFLSDCICLVEWPERGEAMLPSPDLVITISPEGEGRTITMDALSETGQQSLVKLERVSRVAND